MLIAILAILYAFTLATFAYRLTRLSSKREWLAFSGLLILSLLLFVYEQADILLFLSGVIIFNAMISSYGRKIGYLFVALAVFYLWIAYPVNFSDVLQSVFIGMLSGSRIPGWQETRFHKENELIRNLIQIAAGILFIIAFYYLPVWSAAEIAIAFVLLGSILGNYTLSKKRGKFVRAIYSLEKNNSVLGSGARWLAIGLLLAASFLSRNLIIVVFSAIFIGDSFSTLVGINFNTPRLPYNRRKSLGGTLAYFISVFAISYPLIGLISLPIAIFAAAVESQPFHLDDNFDVALAMVVFFIILGHLGLLISY